MKLLIAYIDNANEIEEHNFNKERCSGRTFEPCHPDYKKTSCVFGSCSGHGQNKDKPSNRYKCWANKDAKAWQKD